MDVAVTLSSGGNQAAETAGGAEVTMIPGIPFRIAEMWQRIVKFESDKPGKTRNRHLIAVPRAIRLLDKTIEDLRLIFCR